VKSEGSLSTAVSHGAEAETASAGLSSVLLARGELRQVVGRTISLESRLPATLKARRIRSVVPDLGLLWCRIREW
jgi:hydroxymethylglutaryl-CoA reductase